MDQNVRDFGAVNDGKTLCSSQIQAAIDTCAATGGGRVTIPEGTYLSGTIWLRSHVELHLAHGAVLKGSTNRADYNEDHAFPQNGKFNIKEDDEYRICGAHLIIALECEDVALTGPGKIDGNGECFFGEPTYYDFIGKYCWRDGAARTSKNVKMRLGNALCFVECTDVRVEDFTLFNTPEWGLVLLGCDYVNIHKIRIFNNGVHENTDGIDLDCCTHVTISDCIIDTGDDAIAIRGDSPRMKKKGRCCEYVTITNCVLGSSSDVFRIGVGNGVIRHLRISNIVMTRGALGIEFCPDYSSHGHVCMEDIHFQGISATNISFPFAIYEHNGAYLKNISLSDCYMESYAAIHIKADHKDLLSNIALRNVTIQLMEWPKELEEDYLKAHGYKFVSDPKASVLLLEHKERGTHAIECRNVSGLTLENVRFTGDPQVLAGWESGIKAEECPGLYMQNVTLP